MNKLFFTLMLATLSLTACTGKQSVSNLVNQVTSGLEQIMSNRQQAALDTTAIIILNHPALFTTAKRINGKTQVDETLKAQILDEQEKAIVSLKKISSDIQILYRYRFVLNGLAVIVPAGIDPELIKKIPFVSQVQKTEAFDRPLTVQSETLTPSIDLNKKNSVIFIGADQAHAIGIRGQNMRVGVIDTGIDFTHSMLGGEGTSEAYNAIDPALSTPAFPNRKVVGGIDLCGSDFNEAVFGKNIPKPDANPLDEQGHGTHVAGTIAGIGDGVNTYSGVAPDALLYAIKVFGKKGSTGDHVVIAGLEYAANPKGDLNPEDQLDVVNLSLGSSYGLPHILYSEAIKNLVQGGTVVVASAGNEGPKDHITGSPAATDEALSVAAGIDDMPQNIEFDVIKAIIPGSADTLMEVKEAPIGQAMADCGFIRSEVVHLGLGNNITPDLAEKVKGKIALIDRGQITFVDKAKNAYAAGAIAVLVANNVAGDPFAMSGEQIVPIPVFMIAKDMGQLIKSGLAQNSVIIEIKKGITITKPELIDTITSFSSKGPRSEDSAIKPEITAPGSLIISAAMGAGQKGVALSGTSMSGPHMAGVMTLIKQAHPELKVLDLKSLAMSSTKTIADRSGHVYPISQQGSGRVQTLKAIQAPLVFNTAALSLGEVQVKKQVTFLRTVQVTNITDRQLQLNLTSDTKKMEVLTAQTLTLNAHESKSITIAFKMNAQNVAGEYEEFDGWIKFMEQGNEVARIPFLAVVKIISQIKTQLLSKENETLNFKVENTGSNKGEAYAFNLIGLDPKKIKPNNPQNSYKDTSCDLESAGYRIVEREEKGTKIKYLQFATKLFSPVTTWNYCEVSVMIDTNKDGIADYEIAGTIGKNLPSLSGTDLISVLLNVAKAKEIRKSYEDQMRAGLDATEDYKTAVVDVQNWKTFSHSTVAILEADLTQIPIAETGDFQVQIISQNADTTAIEPDDGLGANLGDWFTLTSIESQMSYFAMPEVIALDKNTQQNIQLKKGAGPGKLIWYYPTNRATQAVQLQSQIQ